MKNPEKMSPQQAVAAFTPERLAQIIDEHRQLKNGIAERILGVPTGAQDWLGRTAMRAEHLRQCEHELRQLILTTAAALDKAEWGSRQMICTNCMGSKLVNGEPCISCQGSGRRGYP